MTGSDEPDNAENLDGVEEPAARQPFPVTLMDVELEQLEEQAREGKEYKEKYVRSLAEMENMRKRMIKERQEMTQYAIGNVIADFLPPLDNLENALNAAQNMSEEVKNWAIGFQMILGQFKEALSQNGVSPYQVEGLPFNPHEHEAIETVETTDYPPGTVIQECTKGYRMGDRMIRPARVKVSKS